MRQMVYQDDDDYEDFDSIKSDGSHTDEWNRNPFSNSVQEPPIPPSPIELSQKFLSLLLSSKQSSISEFLTICAPSMVLMSRPLSSLYKEVQRSREQLKLSAWSTATVDFPDVHSGVGQVSAASRSFLSLMSDLLSPSLMQNVRFEVSVHASSKNVIITEKRDHITAPFSWRTEGMISMGFPEELEFNGLIRCSLGREGITKCTISYDGCKIVRSFRSMCATTTPTTVVAGAAEFTGAGTVLFPTPSFRDSHKQLSMSSALPGTNKIALFS